MAYSLPDDIENQLSKMFPNAPIQSIINYIFEMVITKTTQDSTCMIRNFGTFSAYKTHSSRIGKEVIRFKFKIASSFDRRLKTDTYTINNMPIKAKNVFSEKHEEICKDKREQRDANIVAQKEASKLGKILTERKLAAEEVLDIINEK